MVISLYDRDSVIFLKAEILLIDSSQVFHCIQVPVSSGMLPNNDLEKVGVDVRLGFVLTLYQSHVWLPDIVLWKSKKLQNSSVNEVKRTDIHHNIFFFFGNVNFMQDKAGTFWCWHWFTTLCSSKIRMTKDAVQMANFELSEQKCVELLEHRLICMSLFSTKPCWPFLQSLHCQSTTY